MNGIGDSIDRFVIEAVLGEGGMGRVYRALDPRLGRRVALKVLVARAGEGLDAEGVARMMREARAAAAFNHPNIVTIYEVGESESGPYIAMELVNGATMRALGGDAQVTIATKLSWLDDVARGLAAAHRAGLVHRDIKPDNVMITTDGVVKILDFGIARGAETASTEADGQAPTAAANLPALTAEGQIVGTVHYMAPEQLRGEPLDGRCDQFAWGVMAWELLAGKMPWGDIRNSAMLVTAILSTPARPLRDVVTGVSQGVSDVVARALSKNRETRFRTTDELLGALQGASSRALADDALALGATTPLASVPPAPPEERAGGRKARALGLGALLVALAAAGSLWSFHRTGTREPAPSAPVSPAPVFGVTETTARSLASVTASASIAENDKLEKKVASALRLSLGKEGPASGQPPPDPSSACIADVRAAGIKLRIEPEPNMVGASLLVVKDSFTDLAIAQRGTPEPAVARVLAAGAGHVRSLLDLKLQVRTLSMLALEAAVLVEVAGLRDMSYVRSLVDKREPGGLELLDEDRPEVVAILGRQRQIRTLAASTMAMLVAYEGAIDPRGDAKTLDDLANGMLEAIVQPGPASLDDAVAYARGVSQAALEKGKYESWFRRTYGDDNYGKQYKKRVDFIFGARGTPASASIDAGWGDDAPAAWVGEGPIRDSFHAVDAIVHGDTKGAYAAAVRLAPGGGLAKAKLEALAKRIEVF